MPEVEMWTYNSMPDPESGGIRRVVVNLDAPASRLDRATDTLCLEYPRQVVPAPEVPIQVETEDDAIWFHQHSSIIHQDDGGHRWVAASGVEGVRSIAIGVLTTEAENGAKLGYQLRLHFAELGVIEPGQRVFDVTVQGQRVLSNFDVVDRAGDRNRVVVAQVETRPDGDGTIEIAFESSDGSLRKPLLCGVEIRAFQRGQTLESIVQSYDMLSLPNVYAVISYYLANPSPFDEYLRRCDQDAKAVHGKLEAAGTTDRVAAKELLARARAKGFLRDQVVE